MKKKQAEHYPKITVTETVSLQLDFKNSFGGHAWYHQTATTEDLRKFARMAEEKFGMAVRVSITDGTLTATRTEAA